MSAERPWQLRSIDPIVCARIARDLRIMETTARCLVGRGVASSAEADAFLRPRLGQLRPPSGMAGFAEAVERLRAAVMAGETVGIFGDYDVDGVTAAALLAIFLGQVGATAVVKVAERDAGYGFGEAQAHALAD